MIFLLKVAGTSDMISPNPMWVCLQQNWQVCSPHGGGVPLGGERWWGHGAGGHQETALAGLGAWGSSEQTPDTARPLLAAPSTRLQAASGLQSPSARSCLWRPLEGVAGAASPASAGSCFTAGSHQERKKIRGCASPPGAAILPCLQESPEPCPPGREQTDGLKG